MNPKMYKQAKVAPQIKQRKQEPELLPEWNSYQQDHQKYKMTDSEIASRKEERKPRPRGSEPLLGDKHVLRKQEIRNEELERNDELIDMMIEGLKRKTSAPKQPQKQQPQRRMSTSQQDYEDDIQQELQQPQNNQFSNAQLKIIQDMVKQTPQLNEVLLSQINQLSKQLSDSTVQLQETVLKVQKLEMDNRKLKDEVDELKLKVKVQAETQKAAEFQAFEEVLDKLKYM
ncbi:Conserved_hypothetical protein [Hexamita inflata]|uniref:Uncharacterized protein n=1 Tax=Hexamita inflata TaxID=28002 RepID=A0AA86NZX5_9EUKA|nr:Conserved hypothetical protein [Hexamita inflata]